MQGEVSAFNAEQKSKQKRLYLTIFIKTLMFCEI